MAGQIKKMIDKIIDQRANGNSTIVNIVRTKMILKGINPDKFNEASEDDPAVIEKLKKLEQEL